MTELERQKLLRLDIADAKQECAERAAELEKKILPKLNRRILAVSCGIIFFAFMDRGNLGLAANDICDDLELNHKEYGTGVAVFYIGYVLSQLLSNLLLRRFGAPMWLATILGVWGIVAACFAFIQSPTQFYFLRVLLGFAEGGTFPGIWYYMTLFYPDKFIVKPYSYSVSAIYVSIPASIPIAAGLLQLDGFLGVAGWRHLFFIEGIMPLCYTLVVYFALPRSLDKAKFLTAEEKKWIVAEKGGDQEMKHKGLTFLQEVKTVMKNVVFLKMLIVLIFRATVIHTLSYWMTLIIKDMLDGDQKDEGEPETCGTSGKHQTLAILLTAIPFLFAAVCAFMAGSLLANVKNRTKFAAFVMFVNGTILFTWVFTNSVAFGFGFISLVLAIGVDFFASPILVAFVATLFDQSVRSTALSLYNSLGMVGPIFFPPILGAVVDSYGYSVGIPLISVLYFLASVISFFTKDPLVNARSGGTQNRSEM